MRCVLFALFLVAACATVSAAESYTDAVSAVHRDDYDLAARLFRPLAEQGHAGAQSFLGVLYAHGQGCRGAMKRPHSGTGGRLNRETPRHSSSSVCCVPTGRAYRRIMKWPGSGTSGRLTRGVVAAQFQLGVLFANGQGVPQNYEIAEHVVPAWRLTRDMHGRRAIWVCCMPRGQGLPKDYRVAIAMVPSGGWSREMRSHSFRWVCCMPMGRAYRRAIKRPGGGIGGRLTRRRGRAVQSGCEVCQWTGRAAE